ncbi:MAG: NAD(P)H-hydrate dehydratase [Pseudohongiellaceae bacterium]
MSDSLTTLPKDLYTAAQVRQLDSIAMAEFGYAGFELMQSAANVAFQEILERWPQTRFLRILAGSGNNAGDGFLCASLAAKQGLACEVVAVGDLSKLGADAKKAYQEAINLNVAVITLQDYLHDDRSRPHCIEVDALLGIGLDREVSGDYARAITLINQSENPVVSIDIPSGLSADTGMPLGQAVLADVTVTFIGMKRGMLTGLGRDYCGDILFSDLGVSELVHQSASAPNSAAHRIDINFVSKYLSARQPSSHKGINGHVIVIGGDTRYGGAAILCAQAALRSGAGKVSVIGRTCHRAPALARCPELMWEGTEDFQSNGSEGQDQLDERLTELMSQATALVLGPGLGRSRWSQYLFNKTLSMSNATATPVVIDADGLYWLADKMASGGAKSQQWILTPHPGEAATMLGVSTGAVQKDRFATVANLTQNFGGSCLLKGSGSLICHSGSATAVQLSSEGNPGMATAGMGDLLAGVVGALLGQGLSRDEALSCGVCIHGEAGDLAAADKGERGLLASDLLPWLRQLVNPS